MRPTTLNLGEEDKRPDRRRGSERRHDVEETPSRRLMQSPLVSAVIAALIAALFSCVGSHASQLTDDVSSLANRVTKLEANRVDDSERMERIEGSEQRIENKVDQVLERLAK